jgi:quinol monooxygenase YgiN
MESIVAVTGFTRAKPEHRDKIKEILLSFAIRAREEEGCLQYHVHRDIEDPNLIVFYEVWRSMKDMERHLTQPYLTSFMEDRMRYLEKDFEVHVLGMESPYQSLPT